MTNILLAVLAYLALMVPLLLIFGQTDDGDDL